MRGNRIINFFAFPFAFEEACDPVKEFRIIDNVGADLQKSGTLVIGPFGALCEQGDGCFMDKKVVFSLSPSL